MLVLNLIQITQKTNYIKMQFCLTYKLTTLRQVNIKNYPNYFLIARLTSKIFTQIYWA